MRDIIYNILMKTKLLAIITGIAALAGCGQTQEKKTEKENLYETMEVTLSDRTLTTGYSAAISGVQTVEIRPQVSGMITDILIKKSEKDFPNIPTIFTEPISSAILL